MILERCRAWWRRWRARRRVERGHASGMAFDRRTWPLATELHLQPVCCPWLTRLAGRWIMRPQAVRIDWQAAGATEFNEAVEAFLAFQAAMESRGPGVVMPFDNRNIH